MGLDSSKKTFTRTELDNQFMKTFANFKVPHSKLFSNLEYDKMLIEEEIATLKSDKGKMEAKARKWVDRY